MNVTRVSTALCLSALLSCGQAAAADPSDAHATSILEQGQAALVTIQKQQYQTMLDATLARLMPQDVLVVPSPAPQAAARMKLKAHLALLAMREQLLADYRTGAAARHLASQDYRVQTHGATGQVSSAGTEGPVERARALFKSAKFELPDFMPRGLR